MHLRGEGRLHLAFLLAASSCTAAEPEPQTVSAESASISVTLAHGIVGVAAAPAPETDERPVYALHDGTRALGIDALDAAVDEHTGTLAWIDVAGTLWLAPMSTAPDGARRVDDDVIGGLAAARGRLAYAVRLDGPETAPFAIDLDTLDTIALDDGPGPDEVLAFSPDGSEVLLLSGRTGLASLFAVGVDSPASRQLSNAGLAPGPGLDPAQVVPSPIEARSVSWRPGRISYMSAVGPIALAAPELSR